MNANWNYPTSVKAGVNRVNEIAQICAEFNVSSPLLVTDPGLAALPMLSNVVETAKQSGLNINVFSNIKPNPTGGNVNDGIDVYRQGGHDGVIAFGGGSGLDAGKAIAVAANQSCSMWDLEDIGDNWLNADPAKIPPIIAIPTTAGTGSEVGRASVIVHEEQERKAIIFHPKMLPGCVILDPELTVGLPAKLTAATGMDALSHNLEAFCSPLYHPMAEGIAIEGIRIIKNYLPTAVHDGSDIDARMQMLVASSMGATAFQRGLGGMHALAHPLGAIYDAHHGMLNAILMPYVLIANQSVIKEPISRLARYLELDADFEGFLQWVIDMRQRLGIPNDLAAIGINDDRVSELGEMAVMDPSAGTNPIQHNAAAYTRIVGNAVRGVL
ncbi:MAG: iron-containing alcohol dehydrogenase [Gammaproteobacteria bacterium]|nr:iron-containing alcohol dehydrogenase [Gammaproteobacteria bacterium]